MPTPAEDAIALYWDVDALHARMLSGTASTPIPHTSLTTVLAATGQIARLLGRVRLQRAMHDDSATGGTDALISALGRRGAEPIGRASGLSPRSLARLWLDLITDDLARHPEIRTVLLVAHESADELVAVLRRPHRRVMNMRCIPMQPGPSRHQPFHAVTSGARTLVGQRPDIA